jgi:hypothetical protein
MNEKELLISNLAKLHTTKLGVERVKTNLSLDVNDVVLWCKEQIAMPKSEVIRRGKNWYIFVGGSVLTVNAHSYTVITAHTTRPQPCA